MTAAQRRHARHSICCPWHIDQLDEACLCGAVTGTRSPLFEEHLQRVMSPAAHHPDCDWQFEQYPPECNCGTLRGKPEWFDAHAARCEAKRATAAAAAINSAKDTK